MKLNSGLALLASLSIALISGCGTGEASLSDAASADSITPMPVVVAAPRIADVFATYETTAKIAADAEAPVVARAEGQIVDILVEEGDLVSAGQILARLDGDRARLRMLQAKANLEKASGEYERQLSLHNRGLVSAAAFESLKYDVESLRAGYDLSQLNYEYTIIRAPINGVIALRIVKDGTHINFGDELFKITDTSMLVAYLKIPQTELAKIAPGQHAGVRVDSVPDAVFDATIARISPTIDTRNGTFRATAYLKNKDRKLAPGMFGRFSVAYEKHVDALLVPKDAVVKEDNENVVYIVQDGAAVRRPVSLGIESLGMIEIVGGLSDKEQVIVGGQTGLKDGSKVLADTRTAKVSAG
ncbi:MAG: efflux RND transporter periplasmic adaptor subunit [Gammaproteobacteria bacterium]|nr:efflux RND transporter periplasmic adaptor subunit [Gammaproteobacteria bacterium]